MLTLNFQVYKLIYDNYSSLKDLIGSEDGYQKKS